MGAGRIERMVIAQAAAEYGALAGFARVLTEAIWSAESFVTHLDVPNWVWGAAVVLIMYYALRAPR